MDEMKPILRCVSLRAARELGRHSYGFEVSRDFYNKACEQMLGQAEREETDEQ